MTLDFKTRLENTEYFQQLTGIQKSILSRRTGRIEIEHQYTVAKNIGFAKWELQTAFNHITHGIVKELIDND